MTELAINKVSEFNTKIIQNSIKLDGLECATKYKHNFSEYSLHFVYIKEIYEINLSLEDADEELSHLLNESKNIKYQ